MQEYNILRILFFYLYKKKYDIMREKRVKKLGGPFDRNKTKNTL
jgi:hypothetical protein